MSETHERTTSRTQDEWANLFELFLESKHSTLFGSAMPASDPEERRETAEWYARVIMEADAASPI